MNIKFRKLNKKVVIVIAIPILLYLIYFFGMLFEFEYPYFMTLRKVKQSKTINKQSSINVIAKHLGIKPEEVDLHRCSFCEALESGFPEDTIRVQVLHNKQMYIFAYNPSNNILYPASKEAEAKFPTMGPDVRDEEYYKKTANQSLNLTVHP